MLVAATSPQLITTAAQQHSQGLVRSLMFPQMAICATCHELWTLKIRTFLADVQLAKKDNPSKFCRFHNNGSDQTG